MPAPYAILSDQHCNLWSAFSTINEAGENSRLRIILDDMLRAGSVLSKAGGNVMIFAGDLFHVRGSVDPEVLNPTMKVLDELAMMNIRVVAITGNHDLKSRDTTEIGSAIQCLQNIDGHQVCIKPEICNVGIGKKILMIPWFYKAADVLVEMQKVPMEDRVNMDVVAHVGLSGVFADHGLDELNPATIAEMGFKRFFAGHYHDHRVFMGGKVISIGATTHQTFADIGRRAGFLLVYPDHVEFNESHAPKFVQIDTADEKFIDSEEAWMIADNNYVRVRGDAMLEANVGLMRTELEKMGARGVTFEIAKKTVEARDGAAAHTGSSVQASVAMFIDKNPDIEDDDKVDVKALAQSTLTQAVYSGAEVTS